MMRPLLRPWLKMATLALSAAVVSACGGSAARPRTGTILAVAAENQYANVIGQIGGSYVTAVAIESNPNTDPHSFEASPSVAATLAAARMIVENGAGYDAFIDSVDASASQTPGRLIDVQKLLHLPAQIANPHLWYRPTTMPALARAVAHELSVLEPAHASYFSARARAFDRSLDPWFAAIRAFRRRFPHVRVATTEPVGDYLLSALGAANQTPFSLAADIMNGIDPAPENVSRQDELLSGHRVRVLLYNEQVTDPLTASFLAKAKAARIPVVALYETMPTPGYDYQSWMLAEIGALTRALASGRSTEHL